MAQRGELYWFTRDDLLHIFDIRYSKLGRNMYRVSFFNWCPPKNHKFFFVSKFWHLELFWWDLLCNLTLKTFRGVPVKKITLYVKVAGKHGNVIFKSCGCCLGNFVAQIFGDKLLIKVVSNLCPIDALEKMGRLCFTFWVHPSCKSSVVAGREGSTISWLGSGEKGLVAVRQDKTRVVLLEDKVSKMGQPHWLCCLHLKFSNDFY